MWLPALCMVFLVLMHGSEQSNEYQYHVEIKPDETDMENDNQQEYSTSSNEVQNDDETRDYWIDDNNGLHIRASRDVMNSDLLSRNKRDEIDYFGDEDSKSRKSKKKNNGRRKSRKNLVMFRAGEEKSGTTKSDTSPASGGTTNNDVVEGVKKFLFGTGATQSIDDIFIGVLKPINKLIHGGTTGASGGTTGTGGTTETKSTTK